MWNNDISRASVIAAGLATLIGCSTQKFPGEYVGSFDRDVIGTVLAIRSGGENCPTGVEYLVQVNRDYDTITPTIQQFGQNIVFCQMAPADGKRLEVEVGTQYFFGGKLRLNHGSQPVLYDLKYVFSLV